MPVYEPIFTVGNVVSILIFIVGLAIHGAIVSGKISKFMGSSETDRHGLHVKDDEIEEKIVILDKKCGVCDTKRDVMWLQEERDRMNGEQITLRSEFPLKLEAIWKELSQIRRIVENNRDRK